MPTWWSDDTRVTIVVLRLDRIEAQTAPERLWGMADTGVMARPTRSRMVIPGHFNASAKRLPAEHRRPTPNGDLTDSFVPKRRKSHPSSTAFGRRVW